MDKVFIVVERIAYEGDTVMRVFANYSDAVAYADELTAEQKLPLYIDYDVF
jgi:predicted DNA-binding WGR domain protein